MQIYVVLCGGVWLHVAVCFLGGEGDGDRDGYRGYVCGVAALSRLLVAAGLSRTGSGSA